MILYRALKWTVIIFNDYNMVINFIIDKYRSQLMNSLNYLKRS